jgi:hypothetical protein
MATIASFFKFKVKIPGVSVELTASDEAQFTDKIDSADVDKMGHYVMNIFEMKNYSGAWTTRERGLFGIHYINQTGGALDSSWVTADFTAVETAIQAFFTARAGDLPNGMRLVEHRWYPYGPGFIGTKASPIPPARVTTLGTPIVGSSSGVWVRQVATNCTLRTTLRKHWGRIYLPFVTSGFATEGQYPSANVDAFLGSAKTMLTAAESSQGVVPVVYDRLRKQAYGVIAYEMDSVPDIQRRRRPRDPGYRKVLTA